MPPCGVNGYPASGSYEEMAKVHVQALREKQPVGPYMLGGTCNGGLVAYEMARRLVAEGERIDMLILIGASAFNLRLKGLRQLLSPLGIVSQHAESRAFIVGKAICQKSQLLSPSELAAFLLSKVPRLIGQLRDRMLGDARPESAPRTAFREGLREAYQRIDRQYWPGSYPGKVTLFWWEGEDEGPDEAARCWSRVAGSVELHRFPRGKHIDFLTGNIEIVAEKLRSCLDAADRALLVPD